MATASSKSYDWDEDQLHVLADSVDHGVLLINSVPGSGKTQLLIEKTLASPGIKTLIISLTNAVRTEIAERIKDTCERNAWVYKYTIEGHHNIFVLKDFKTLLETVVHVATLDSWVYESLAELSGQHGFGGPTDVLSVDHDGRRQLMLEVYTRRGLHPQKCLLDYDQIAIDEIQDLDHAFYCIVIEIAKQLCGSESKPRRRLILAGDPDQNVFARSDYCIVQQIRNDLAINDGLYFREYDLRYNHRCPPAHIRFANAALKPVCLGREIRWTPGKPDGEKPFLVKVNSGFSDTANSNRASSIFKLIIDCVDSGYCSLGDIVLLAPTSGSNKLYGHLENKLRRKYDSIDSSNNSNVAWIYSTNEAEDAIDWDAVAGKLVMSSVHANKGRTHKVVIACDFTDGVFPKLHSVPPRRIDIEAQVSQALVSLTRATDRLYVVYSDPMTRFFDRNLDDFCTHIVMPQATQATQTTQTTQISESSESSESAEIEDRIVYDPEDPTANLKVPEDYDTTVRKYLANKISAKPSELVLLAKSEIERIGGPEIYILRRPLPTNSFAANTEIIRFFKRNQLNHLFGYFGQCLLYHEVLGLPLAPRIDAYSRVLIVPYGADYFFSRIQDGWADAVAKDPTGREWYDYPNRQLNAVDANGIYVYGSARNNINKVLAIVRRIIATAVPNGWTPLHFVLATATKKSMDICFNKMIRTVNAYKRFKNRRDLWNIAVMMTGLNNGIFASRPWLTMLIEAETLPIDIYDPIFERICENGRAIYGFIGSSIADFERPLTLRMPDGRVLSGRMDLVLSDGTIVDVKCSIPGRTKDTVVATLESGEQVDVLSDLDVHSARDICQLLMYAEATGAPAVQLWDIGTGAVQSCRIKK